MKLLTPDSLAELITSCNEMDGYKSFVILHSASEVCNIIDAFSEKLDTDGFSGIMSTEYNHTEGLISFKNGSYIKTITARNASRSVMRGANNILFDVHSGLSAEELENIKAFEMEYKYDDPPKSKLYRSKELDKFLNKFKIIKEI